MRISREVGGLRVNVVAGTHVVLLGLDLSASARKGCLGFAIQRTDHTENEQYWMSGMKAFASTDPGLGIGGQVSSRQHPFQSFQWSDYSAKPGHDYMYRVVAMYGTPQKLEEGATVDVPISTETEYGDTHSVFFNRGAIASQEYARRFNNLSPDKAGPGAYRWLSRGLIEAFQEFVGRAVSNKYSLNGAIYEFQLPEALGAIKDAHKRGAKVDIVYDAIPGKTNPKPKNNAAIKTAGIKGLCHPKTCNKIMHNKFIVLSKDDRPIAVWLGSTNLTVNGVYGHLNLGHIVDDARVAREYFEYWKELRQDDATADEKDWMAANNPAPPAANNTDAIVEIFSPRKGIDVLEWYGELAGTPKAPLFMTFAFGMHKIFQDVYEKGDGVLRMALMEKEGNGKALAQGKIDIKRIRKLPNVVISVAKHIEQNSFDRWHWELSSPIAKANVRYVHTKFMLVDPLGDNPIVVTGSANFSKASTDTNEENMIVIRGSKRVADIYLGEFLRSYSHYAFREAVSFGGKDWKPSFLGEDDGWLDDYFKAGSSRFLRRKYFAGA